SGMAEQPLRLAIEFEQSRGTPERAIPFARDLLALEEALSGNTSEAYLQVLETAAQVYESGRDPAQALLLRKQAIAIADLAGPGFETRASVRLTAASAYASQNQFDEAIRLAAEAIEILERLPAAQLRLQMSQANSAREMIRNWKRRASLN